VVFLAIALQSQDQEVINFSRQSTMIIQASRWRGEKRTDQEEMHGKERDMMMNSVFF